MCKYRFFIDPSQKIYECSDADTGWRLIIRTQPLLDSDDFSNEDIAFYNESNCTTGRTFAAYCAAFPHLRRTFDSNKTNKLLEVGAGFGGLSHYVLKNCSKATYTIVDPFPYELGFNMLQATLSNLRKEYWIKRACETRRVDNVLRVFDTLLTSKRLQIMPITFDQFVSTGSDACFTAIIESHSVSKYGYSSRDRAEHLASLTAYAQQKGAVLFVNT